MEKSNNVKSVEKALQILNVLSDADELSLGEISQQLKIDKGTTHRLTATLRSSGYVEQNTKNKKYSLSFKVFEMGNKTVDKRGLRKTAEPFIEECSKLVGETVNLGIRHKSNVIYIDKIESHETIKVGLSIGKKIPLYCTGLGKVMLAFYKSDLLESIIADQEFVNFTSHTVKSKSELMFQLRKIRTDGYFIDFEEYIEGLICIAAPIFDYLNEPIAAISISIPKYRFDINFDNNNNNKIDYSKIVIDTANKISTKLGYKNGGN
jgi:DNA-binding IclR family transcriptional regulator